ncbi:MAG: response regulator [Planctomycetes bacterium]|nr:response regulator [Planctomycetota bacterium]
MTTPLRALLVEDSADDALLLADELRRGGRAVTVRRVDTADAFRAALRSESWDVVLADYSLPHFSGRDALHLLHELGLDLPFVIVTGTIGEEVAVAAMRQGAHDYLLKGKLARLGVVVEREIRDAAERRGRQSAELRLRESERRQSLLLQSLPIALYTRAAGNDQGFTWVSDSLRRLTGMAAEELLGDPALWAGRVHPEDRERRAAGAELPAPGGCTQVEYRWRHADGGWRWFLDSSLPLGDEPGPAPVVAGFLLDISARKEIEGQLIQSQRREAIGRLAGSLAHDFNNLLGVIRGFTDLALTRTPSDRQLLEDLQEISGATALATGLTRKLLTLSRQQVAERLLFDPRRALLGMERMLRSTLTEGIALHVITRDEVGAVRMDPSQLEQVILNLALNARDAMPQGGRLVVELANATREEAQARGHRLPTAGPHVRLTLADTGSGIPSDLLPNLFEPVLTSKPAGRGIGLGLSTVNAIVQQNEGAVYVESRPGYGTTFTLYFPQAPDLVPPAAAAESPPEPVAEVPATKETILVVEDEPTLRQLAGEILSWGGYRPLICGNGQEALQLLESHRGDIALLLTDVIMPRMNGREVARRVLSIRPDLRVLYMSGYTDDVLPAQKPGEPPVNFIQKPFSLAGLLAKVREVLDAPQPGMTVPSSSAVRCTP